MRRSFSASAPARASSLSLLTLLVAGAAWAQDGLPVVVVYQDQIFERSRAGQAVRAAEEAETRRLLDERRRIEGAFEAEERDLAALRPTVPREDFATLAADFDARVRAARANQDQIAAATTRKFEANRQAFSEAVRPVLSEVMRRYGASVLLDGRAVLRADPSIDVTGEVIDRLDARLPAPPDAAPPDDAPMDPAPPAPAP